MLINVETLRPNPRKHSPAGRRQGGGGAAERWGVEGAAAGGRGAKWL